MMFQVVILAGGLATRLGPLTTTLPKSLIDINGEPFISHQLKLLKKNHIQKVLLCLGHFGEQIVKFIEDGKKYGLQIEYSFDGQQQLGTAGAIYHARERLEEHFFVMYGDSYLNCNYADIQKKFLLEKKRALMTVFENGGLWDKSNIEYENGRIKVYDKMHRTEAMKHIDYGLGIFSRTVFQSDTLFPMDDLAYTYKELLLHQELSAYEVKERFYEIGSFSGINELRNYLATKVYS